MNLRPAPPEISIVIVSYNTRALLERCIASLPDAVAGRAFEVLVVDNASRDDSVAFLRERLPWVRCIARDRNYGFASSMNLGMRESHGATIVWLNPDCEALPGSLATLAEWLEAHPGDGAAGPSIEWPDGSVQPGAQSFPTPLRLVARSLGLRRLAKVSWIRAVLLRIVPRRGMVRGYLTAFEPARDTRSVDWITGACLATRRDVVARVGGLDESFFMYGEDTDWCRRVRAAGLNITTLASSRVRHAASASGHHNPDTDFYYRESLVLYFARHSRGFAFVRLWVLTTCGVRGLASTIAAAFGRHRPHRWWDLCRLALTRLERLREPRVPTYPAR